MTWEQLENPMGLTVQPTIRNLYSDVSTLHFVGLFTDTPTVAILTGRPQPYWHFAVGIRIWRVDDKIPAYDHYPAENQQFFVIVKP